MKLSVNQRISELVSSACVLSILSLILYLILAPLIMVAGSRVQSPRDKTASAGALMALAATPTAAVKLIWDDTINTNLIGYRINMNGTNVAAVLVPTNSVTISNLVIGTTYRFTAIAWNAAKQSDPSNELVYTPTNASVQTFVLVVKETLVTRTGVDVSSRTVEQPAPATYWITNTDPKKYRGVRLDISTK